MTGVTGLHTVEGAQWELVDLVGRSTATQTNARARVADALGTQFPVLADDLAVVEQSLLKSAEAPEAAIPEAFGHLIKAGGKRLRPVLVLLAAYTAAGDRRTQQASDEVVTAATAVELFHLATLHHDDVMDAAMTRRGNESVNAAWGNAVAILCGDFLLAQAANALARLGERPLDMLSGALRRVCLGQMLETSQLYDRTRTRQSYLEATAGKTAALMAASSAVGAMEVGADDEVIKSYERFGHRLGLAFQLADDLLDVLATEEQAGKPTGNDIREGAYSLPVIVAMESSEELRALLGRRLDDAEVARALEIVRSSEGVAHAAELIECELRGAHEALLATGECPPEAATAVVEFVAASFPALPLPKPADAETVAAESR